MVRLMEVARFLNSVLKPRSVHDRSRNGLQFKGKAEVKKIAFAVDASMQSFEMAKKAKADLIVVHHGIIWKGHHHDKTFSKRMEFLKKNNISLYASHLPLDKHPMYGHNIQIAWRLGLTDIKPFGVYKGQTIGYEGISRSSLSKMKSCLDNTFGVKSKLYDFSGGKSRKVAVVSGGGASLLGEAAEKKINCLVTGEFGHENYSVAREGKVSVIQAGHYATETVGVKVLEKLLKQKFNIETVFLDIPTGL